jgi:glucose-1-phosphate thymidylyltransferase
VIQIKGLILSAGHGTRLRPLTHTSAKQLIPIANKPIIFYAIEDLKNAGINDIGIIVGHTEDRIKNIKETIGDGSKFGVSITYIEQDAPRGIAHAIGLAEKFIGNEPFVTYLGDNLLKGGITDYVIKFKNSDYDAGILLAKHKTPERFGVAVMNGDKIVGLIEKPKNPPSNFVMTGVYLLKPTVFDVIKKLKLSWRNELEITETIDKMIKSNKYKVMVQKVNGWWKDTGKPEDILEANQLVLSELKPFNKGKIEEGVTIRGKIAIDEGTVIKKGSFIRGPSIIGKNCIIGPNVYIGPYTSIGDNTIIKNGEIESSVIVGDTVIECNKRITDSLIGKNVNIVSADDNIPKSYKLVLGENSFISI